MSPEAFMVGPNVFVDKALSVHCVVLGILVLLISVFLYFGRRLG